MDYMMTAIRFKIQPCTTKVSTGKEDNVSVERVMLWVFILKSAVKDSMYAQANLVPVTDNFQWPDTDSLPEDIRAVGYFNSVRWVHDYQVGTDSPMAVIS